MTVSERGPGGGGGVSVVERTLYWFQDDDREGTLLANQMVTVTGPDPLDDFNQGKWALTGIGPYYVSPNGLIPPSPRSLLRGPISAISGPGIPWWFLQGLTPQPPLPSVPTIHPSPSGSAQPWYY